MTLIICLKKLNQASNIIFFSFSTSFQLYSKSASESGDEVLWTKPNLLQAFTAGYWVIDHPCTSSRFQHLFKLNQNLNESVHRLPVIQGQLVRGHTMEPRKIKRFDNFGSFCNRKRTLCQKQTLNKGSYTYVYNFFYIFSSCSWIFCAQNSGFNPSKMNKVMRSSSYYSWASDLKYICHQNM